MMNALEPNKARQEIIKLHTGILDSMSRTVPDAIRIGQIIAEQKEQLEHGRFLPWVETLPFDQKTAWRYSKLCEYQNKLGTMSNLQEAYKQIESLEAIEKRKEDERKQALIRERIKTGEKPEGWDRSLDYEYNKRKEYGGYAKIKDDFEIPKKEKQEASSDSSFINQAADMFIEQSQKRNDFKNKIRLSDSGKNEPFIDAIMDYLVELENDNRRIEACNNIIKVCRNICVKLQASIK
jgi:hypothetical protein